MGKKGGLSLEEKRARLLDVFHETGEVFVLKEVEKLGIKKGITPQKAKDILQSLVDDDLVHQERIGISNYFWSFPGELAHQLERDLDKTKAGIEVAVSSKTDLKSKLESASCGRKDSEERREKLKLLKGLKSEVSVLEKELDTFREFDPETIVKLREAVDTSKSTGNLWLDNIFLLHSWCKKHFPGCEKEIKGLFELNGINEETDYIE